MGAAELRDHLPGTPPLRRPSRPAGPAASSLAPDLLAALATEQIFQSMADRINGPRVGDQRLLLRWEFESSPHGIDGPATGETWTLLLSNGALTPHARRRPAPRREPPHATLRLARTTLNAVLSGATTFPAEIAAGTVTFDGDPQALLTFNTLLDKPDPAFPIVTP